MTDVLAAEPLPARSSRLRARWLVVLVGLGLLLIAGGVVAIVVERSSAPPSLVHGLSDRRPDPQQGISGGSFPVDSDIFSLELGTFLCGIRDVHITSVSLYRPTPGFSLVRWGFANLDGSESSEIGSSPRAGPLIALGPFTSHTITRHCGETDSYARVGLQLRRTQTGTQSFLGLRVTYQSAGRQKSAYLWERYRVTETRKP